jgi:TonB family protein
VSLRSLALATLLATGAAGAAGPPPPAAKAPAAPVSDGMAVPVHHVPPKYPKSALKAKTDGCVVLSFLLDADGKASDIQVVESLPKGVFDAATLKDFGQWRFQKPPRPGRYAQLVQFRLEGREAVNVCKPLPSYAALNPGAPPLTRQLRVLETVMPRYPRSGASIDGGCVTVRFQIKHDGFVGDVVVLEARPEALAAPTVEAIKQWHFQSFEPPAMYATQTFNFAPDIVRMPENMIRQPYADLEGGQVRAIGCGGKPAARELPADAVRLEDLPVNPGTEK